MPRETEVVAYRNVGGAVGEGEVPRVFFGNFDETAFGSGISGVAARCGGERKGGECACNKIFHCAILSPLRKERNGVFGEI